MKDINDYIRVTDVLFPFSGLKNIPTQILQNAAERGTKVHEICDAIINNIGFCDIEERFKGYIESFNRFFINKDFIQKPERFFCENYKITGECDAIYKDKDGLVLVDIKTSASEGKTWNLQGSAYSSLAKAEGYDIKRIEFVKLCKAGKEPKVFLYEENFDTFLKCLEIYKLFFKDQSEENILEYM